ncbi:MAG TPA: STAS domain-containing protein [Bryobacteraceae bacterium]|nr:STAS domain-containing protein [Bryobacteraceae bacterium]
MDRNNRRIGGPELPKHRSCAVIDVEQAGEICVVRCRGCLLAGLEADYVDNKVDQIRQQNCTKVLADFREVPAIGSAGIAFIVGVYKSVVRNSGGRMVVAGAGPMVRRVLELTRLTTMIHMADDFESGIAALSADAAAAAAHYDVC